jgi:hypothetical protein
MVPTVTQADLPALASAFPGLDFDDEECRAVLLEGADMDIQAAPGSGKTTILAAKLYLLARKWTAERSGVCVISHTNTAAREIRERLAASVDGGRLLSYPHFIGTIHAFANQFLAMPAVRAAGIQVDCIDDEVFARRALKAARGHGPTRFWMTQAASQREAVVATLSFAGPGLGVVSKAGAVPKTGKPVGDFLDNLKRRLASAGFFRHDDMLALAEDMLADHPRLTRLLAARFPLVMLDEMQDTSPRQAALIAGAFGNGVTTQRFGDANQRIFDDGTGAIDFPRTPFLSMSASRRFGPAIAEVVSRLRESGPPVVGKGPVSPHRPTVLVYETDALQRVIPFFGEAVLARFDDETLSGGRRVQAICARRSGTANQSPGRHVGDFWPALASAENDAPARLDNAWRLLAPDPGIGRVATPLGERAERARRVVLLALREAGAPAADNVREPWRLFRALHAEGVDLAPMRGVCRRMAMDADASVTPEGRERTVALLHDALAPLLPAATALHTFARLPLFAALEDDDAAADALGGVCHVTVGERHLAVDVDTVAMTKGETHLATLYLESYGLSRRFDIPDVAHLLAGQPPAKGKLPPTVPPQRRHVYVGLSRPTDFLCVAVNRARLSGATESALREAGWDILTVA